MNLSEMVTQETSRRFFISRFVHSIKAICQEKGCAAGVFTTSALTIAKVYCWAICYFGAEGVVRALMDVAKEDEDQIIRLRPFGDAGGWSAQCVFTVLALGTLMIRVVREGEGLRLKSICQKWVDDNQDALKEDPQNIYSQILEVLDSFHTQCLFSKWVVSRRITALSIKHKHCQAEERRIDKRLKQIYLEIHKDLRHATANSKYFQRVFDGQRSHLQQGCRTFVAANIMGIALPLIMLVSFTLSYVGEPGLIKQVLYDKEDQTDAGHIGEWLFNAIEIITVALIFHFSSMINEGDFVRARRVYAHYLEKLKAEKEIELYNRLSDVANAELAQLQSNRLFFQLPGLYKFKQINEKELQEI